MLVTFYFSSQGKNPLGFVCQKPFPCLSSVKGGEIPAELSQPTVSSRCDPGVLLQHFCFLQTRKIK